MILKDKIIVITGGRQGFGKALAQLFVSEEAKIIISSHDENTLKQTAQELGCDHFRADVTSIQDVKTLGAYVFEKYKAIDIWINNAGIQIAPSILESVSTEKLHRLFEVNFFGYFYGCQTALSYMKKQKGGTIININSTAGLEGKPEISAYSASKFAVKGLTESIRKEVSDANITVLGIFPGGMRTDIYREKYPSDLDKYMEVGYVAEKVVANLKSENPEMDLIIKRPAA